MKMSEITVDDLALYMRIDDPSDDENLRSQECLPVALHTSKIIQA